MTQENHNLEITSTVAKHEGPSVKEEGGLLEINGTMLVVVVSFIIFAVIMQKIFYGPIIQIKQKRRDYIKNMKEQAVQASIEAEKLNQDYLQNLRNARKEVNEKTTESIAKANEEKTKILNEKKQEVLQYLNTQNELIQNEKTEAIDSLKSQILDYAYNISKKVLGEETSLEGLNPEIVEKAINR